MSYGSIAFFGQDGAVADEVRYPNGWGMGPVLWDIAFQNARSLGRTTRASTLFWLLDQKSRDPHLSWAMNLYPVPRSLLLMTLMEPTAVAREHWPEVVSNLFYAFNMGFKSGKCTESDLDALDAACAKSENVNHWPAIARELHRRKDDESLIAFGVYSTSVNDYPFHGKRHPEDEALDEPFDVRKDSWWYTPGPEPTRAPLGVRTAPPSPADEADDDPRGVPPTEFSPDVTPRPAPKSKTAADYPGSKKAPDGG